MKLFKFFYVSIFFCLSFASTSQITISHTNKPFFLKKQQIETANSHLKTTATYAPGKSVNYYWNLTANNWQLNDTTIYTYNAQGLLSEELRKNGPSKSRKLYTYDSKQRLTQELYQYYSSYWTNSSLNLIAYDQNDYRIESSYSYFNTSSNQWEISGGFKNIITYNSNNKIISNVSQDWNGSLDAWEDNYKYTNYIYNSNGMATQYDTQTKYGSLWQNNSRVKSTYSIYNQLIELIIENWNGSAFVKNDRFTNISWHAWSGATQTGEVSSFTTQVWGSPIANQWNTDARYSATFDAYGGYVAVGQNYVNNTWENDYRQSDFYDSKSNQIGYRNESWQNSSWTIDDEEKIIHYYDFSGNIVISEWQYWDYVTAALKNSQKKVYSDFVVVTSLADQINADKMEVSVFPNPFHTSCTIRIGEESVLKSNELYFKLFDIFGKEVLKQKVEEAETRIEKGDLNSGIYFYSVMDKTSSVAKGKLVVE